MNFSWIHVSPDLPGSLVVGLSCFDPEKWQVQIRNAQPLLHVWQKTKDYKSLANQNSFLHVFHSFEMAPITFTVHISEDVFCEVFRVNKRSYN